MPSTKNLVVEASHLPVSIIIIGVGDEEFQLMEALDCDKGIIKNSQGTPAARDIVQFVKFKKFVTQHDQDGSTQAKLAEKVLQEIPDQIVDYMLMKDIKPPSQTKQ